MRAFIANIIYRFARLMSFMMNTNRRADTLNRATILLANFHLKTKNGSIHITNMTKNDFSSGIDALKDEKDTVEWIESIPDGSCFWDIGANVGIFSMIAAKNHYHIYSFEPQVFTYSTLIHNLQNNNMTDVVNASQIAFYDRTVIDTLNMSSNESGSAFNIFGDNSDQYGNKIDGYSYHIMGYAIDDFIKIFNPIHPTHVKIDVDGLEPQILLGGLKTFNSNLVKSVIIETEGSDQRINKIHDTMLSYGFNIRPKTQDCRNTIYDRA